MEDGGGAFGTGTKKKKKKKKKDKWSEDPYRLSQQNSMPTSRHVTTTKPLSSRRAEETVVLDTVARSTGVPITIFIGAAREMQAGVDELVHRIRTGQGDTASTKETMKNAAATIVKNGAKLAARSGLAYGLSSTALGASAPFLIPILVAAALFLPEAVARLRAEGVTEEAISDITTGFTAEIIQETVAIAVGTASAGLVDTDSVAKLYSFVAEVTTDVSATWVTRGLGRTGLAVGVLSPKVAALLGHGEAQEAALEAGAVELMNREIGATDRAVQDATLEPGLEAGRTVFQRRLLTQTAVSCIAAVLLKGVQLGTAGGGGAGGHTAVGALFQIGSRNATSFCLKESAKLGARDAAALLRSLGLPAPVTQQGIRLRSVLEENLAGRHFLRMVESRIAEDVADAVLKGLSDEALGGLSQSFGAGEDGAWWTDENLRTMSLLGENVVDRALRQGKDIQAATMDFLGALQRSGPAGPAGPGGTPSAGFVDTGNMSISNPAGPVQEDIAYFGTMLENIRQQQVQQAKQQTEDLSRLFDIEAEKFRGGRSDGTFDAEELLRGLGKVAEEYYVDGGGRAQRVAPDVLIQENIRREKEAAAAGVDDSLRTVLDAMVGIVQEKQLLVSLGLEDMENDISLETVLRWKDSTARMVEGYTGGGLYLPSALSLLLAGGVLNQPSPTAAGASFGDYALRSSGSFPSTSTVSGDFVQAAAEGMARGLPGSAGASVGSTSFLAGSYAAAGAAATAMVDRARRENEMAILSDIVKVLDEGTASSSRALYQLLSSEERSAIARTDAIAKSSGLSSADLLGAYLTSGVSTVQNIQDAQGASRLVSAAREARALAAALHAEKNRGPGLAEVIRTVNGVTGFRPTEATWLYEKGWYGQAAANVILGETPAKLLRRAFR